MGSSTGSSALRATVVAGIAACLAGALGVGVLAAGVLATAVPQAAAEPIVVDGEPSPAPSILAPLPLPLPLPDPTPTPTPTPTPDPSPTGTPPSDPRLAVVAPDLVDRQWPRHPPWDACPRPVWPGEVSPGTPGNGRRVLVLGDSLTRDSRVLTQRAMRASGWTPTFRCWGSKRLDWGIAQVRRAKQLGQLPRHVIIALGTNDISWETPATTVARVRALLRLLGPQREVLWVDLDVDHSSFSRSRARWFNAMIRDVAASRENLTVVPWRRVARSEGAGRYDGIHYGASGYRLRARTVAAALDSVG